MLIIGFVSVLLPDIVVRCGPLEGLTITRDYHHQKEQKKGVGVDSV